MTIVASANTSAAVSRIGTSFSLIRRSMRAIGVAFGSAMRVLFFVYLAAVLLLGGAAAAHLLRTGESPEPVSAAAEDPPEPGAEARHVHVRRRR